MSEDNTPENDTPVAADATDTGAEGHDGHDGDESQVSAVVAALGVTRMSLQELKETSPADLLALAEKLELDNANSMRKQDMMFGILKTVAEEGIEISGSGTM
jgi:transcription termination factor Rho